MSFFIHNELCCKYLDQYYWIQNENLKEHRVYTTLTTLYRPGSHEDTKYEADKKTGTGGVLHDALIKLKARSIIYFYTFRTLKTFSLFFEQ